MADYARLRADVEALVAKPGAVKRAEVYGVLRVHPPVPPVPPSAEDVFDDDVFDPSVFD